MKKHLLTSLLLLLTLSVVSCGATSAKTDKQTKTDNAMKPMHITKADFLTKIADYETSPSEFKYLGDQPAIIDFYATWCGPCKALAPILDDLAAQYAGKVHIYKVDIDKEPDLAAAFGVQSVPSLLFVPMKGQPQMAVGMMPKTELDKAIKEVLLK